MAIDHASNDVGAQLHLNMMTDTLIANLPADGLRAIVRSLIAIHPKITASFEQLVRQTVQQRADILLQSELEDLSAHSLKQTQSIIRCMLGSGLVFESLPLLAKLTTVAALRVVNADPANRGGASYVLASLDGDLVQAMTAIGKALVVPTGARALSIEEKSLVQGLFDSLSESDRLLRSSHQNGLYDRGLTATAEVLGTAETPTDTFLRNGQIGTEQTPEPPVAQETFVLGDRTLPRIFSGLWQLSSPAWGSAPTSKIIEQFNKHVKSGLTAFDMADHYGDAELIFGRFRSHYHHKERIFAATKTCVFQRMETVSREAMAANVSERCRRMQQPKLDLLQFHWQHYEDESYLDALGHLVSDPRVGMVGLCNFDTVNLKRVLDAGITIYANQVQFSLIDSRPVEQMAAVCTQHNIKLLTYGTLCGGFLSEKWIDQPEPDLYNSDGTITPSQRKYYSMICNWGGWDLLQELLRTLRDIAVKHNVPGISNVATRWVLDFPYVGAVLVGTRMGVSDHLDANMATFGWQLDDQDRADIEAILKKSKRKEVFELMGDCGAEYRT